MASRQQPNAKEKRWLESVCKFIDEAGLGILYGPEFEGRTDYQIRHVKGRTYKHNKVAIGHWFILPVPVELHDVHSNHPDNVTHFKHNFTRRFGLQSELFKEMCELMVVCDESFKLPFRANVEDAIMDTKA